MNQDDEKPASPEELAAAARLADELERDETAEMIRAAAGRSAPLGDLRARALARAALKPQLRQRRWLWPAVAALAVLLLILGWRLRPDRLPERLAARSAGVLVPGPFPASQTAAERLDLVTADRLIALREASVLRLQRGGQ